MQFILILKYILNPVGFLILILAYQNNLGNEKTKEIVKHLETNVYDKVK